MGIFGGVGASQTFSSASGGKVYAFNGLTQALAFVCAPASPARQQITFHNPGPVDVFVYPLVVQVNGANLPTYTDQPLTPTINTLGGCFRIFANGGSLTINGECQGRWGTFAVDNSATGCLTVMDSNIS